MSTLEAKQLEIPVPLYVSRKQEFEITTKLSRIIEIALEDLEQAEKDDVCIDMGNWLVYMHPPKYKPWAQTECFACFAGCVMKNTFNIKSSVGWLRRNSRVDYYGPSLRDEKLARRFYALDSVRSGHFNTAWENMYDVMKQAPEWVNLAPHFPPYKTNPEEFKQGLRRSIEFFRNKGY